MQKSWMEMPVIRIQEQWEDLCSWSEARVVGIDEEMNDEDFTEWNECWSWILRKQKEKPFEGYWNNNVVTDAGGHDQDGGSKGGERSSAEVIWGNQQDLLWIGCGMRDKEASAMATRLLRGRE